MAENDDPLFPRPAGISEAEYQKMLEATRQKLENAEKPSEVSRFEPGTLCPACGTENRANTKFCRSCGIILNRPEITPPMYGPPPMPLENEPVEPLIHRTMYGPPPMELDEEEKDPFPPESMSIMYGPPPMRLEDKTEEVFRPLRPLKPEMPDYFPPPAYGPPPMRLDAGTGKRFSGKFWLILGGVVVLLGFFGLVVLAILYFISLRFLR